MKTTQLSLRLLRKEGYFCEVVEHWVSPPFKAKSGRKLFGWRKDMLGYADILALSGNDTVTVQTTSWDNVGARIRKIKCCPGAEAWLHAPSRRIEVHGWRNAAEEGKRAKWDLKRVQVTLEDIHSD